MDRAQRTTVPQPERLQDRPELELSEVNCLFEQPWWLDAVASGAWRVAEVRSGGELQARMPFVVGRLLGLTWIKQPPLTQTLGPWIRASEGKYCSTLARQKSLMFALIEQLPPHDIFSQSFHHSVHNWLPFFWKGFTAIPNYTYVLDDLSDSDRLWQALEENARWAIRKASKLVVVDETQDIERFLQLYTMTFTRQGLPPTFSKKAVRQLDDACSTRGRRKMLFAVDGQNRTHAAEYLVWDDRCAYYLMGGADPELRSSGATSLLMWEGIKFAATVTRSFDFEGSMGESIERFFRSFGARQAIYFNVRRMSRRMRALNAGRELARSVLGLPERKSQIFTGPSGHMSSGSS